MSVSSIVDKIWLRNEIDKVVNSIIQDDFEEASYDVKGDFRFIVLVDRTANIYELHPPQMKSTPNIQPLLNNKLSERLFNLHINDINYLLSEYKSRIGSYIHGWSARSGKMMIDMSWDTGVVFPQITYWPNSTKCYELIGNFINTQTSNLKFISHL